MKNVILQQAALDSQKEKIVLSLRDLSNYPKIVQYYLRNSLEEGREAIYYANLKHGGEFRTSPDQPWFSIKGEYHYLAYEPAFIWRGIIKPLPILAISARDFYFRGKGEMKIRLNGIIPLGKSVGPEMDEASLMRYVSEAPLFPSVFLTAKFISWEEIDSSSVKINIRDRGVKAEGVFTFNNLGEIIKYESTRARDTKEGPKPTKWTGNFSDYKDFDGFRIPTYFIAEWNLPQEDFQYVRFKVNSIEFNKL
ncbi:MAG: hypothetical protein HGN29_04265 [Asgard group archaeon]|nr:hypothetical protein [Asgard group archaeon]